MTDHVATTALLLISAAALLAAGIWAVVHIIRGACRTCDAILNDLHQPRKEKQP